jgi:cephalosporin hydroxylase
MTLDEIAIKHGCDKSSLKHDYCRIYEQYFSKMHPVHLLEIGYGGYDDPDKGGESALMWLEWMGYHHANEDKYKLLRGDTITITDIHHKNNVPEGVLFLQTDVTNPECFNKHYYNTPHYDIIIDDGSHMNADIIAAFKNLWPVLNPGGLYCVEDLHSSYSDYYPDSKPEPNGEGTAMQFFTYLSHSPNIPFIDPVYHIGLYKGIEFIHFYKDLIIIKKKAA